MTTLDPQEARARFAAAPLARLATADQEGRPHLVPLVFAVDGDRIVSAVDFKPKRSTALRRLANLAADPRACLLVDHYADDWTALWWARADGRGEVWEPDQPAARAAVDLLVAKYPQYQAQRPAGPVVIVTVERWSGWSAEPPR
jgi:PPOX class probable F420-dependent enzyme